MTSVQPTDHNKERGCFTVTSPAVRKTGVVFGMLLAALLATGAVAQEDKNPLVDHIVIVANKDVPKSLELAKYYAEKRGIPPERICALDLPDKEKISRKTYEKKLRDPLLSFLREKELIAQVARDPDTVEAHESAWTTTTSSIRYLVSMYGVPLRIADTRPAIAAKVASEMGEGGKKDTAAVDAELAMLLMPAYSIKGPAANPLFNELLRPGKGANGEFFVVAGRLDGPTPEIVRRMINDTLDAEHYGLLGRGYFDSREIADSPYVAGDYWIIEACERFRREGYECILDRGAPLWGEAYPMEDVALYFGWYAEDIVGPFNREGFRFRPGAIAYHIHSGSAATLRSDEKRWAGPLLERGATATMGAVTEPYLPFTPQLHLFADRLCNGHVFGDSAYMSMQAASWEMTVVGDPLYRPFRYPLAVQIQHLEEDNRPEVEWAYLRQVNLLVREGRFNVALAFCRRKASKLNSVVLREKVADLYARNDLLTDAGAEYEEVLKAAKTPETAVRAGGRLLLILRLLGQDEQADAIEARIREQWKGSPVLSWLEVARP